MNKIIEFPKSNNDRFEIPANMTDEERAVMVEQIMSAIFGNEEECADNITLSIKF